MDTFALAVLLLTITPGPAVLTLAGVGSAFGWRHGVWFIWFICWRSSCLFRRDIWFGGADHYRSAGESSFVAGLVSLSWLSRLKNCTGRDKNWIYSMAAPGFVTGVMLQLINPKAYAVNTMLFSSFNFYPDNFAIETGLKLLINNAIWIPIHFLWLYAGEGQPAGLASANPQKDQFCYGGVSFNGGWSVVMVTVFEVITGKRARFRNAAYLAPAANAK